VNSRQILLFAIRDSLEFPVWHFYFFQLQLLIAVAWSVWKWYLIWSMSIVLKSICGEKQWHILSSVHSNSSGDFGPRHYRNTWPNVRKPRTDFILVFYLKNISWPFRASCFKMCAADHKSLCLMKSIFFLFTDW